MVEPDAGEVEPLDGALLVIAADHLAVGHLLTQTVRRLVRVDGQVGRRHLPLRLPFRPFLLLGRRFGPLLPRRAHLLGVIQTPITFPVFPVLLPPRTFPPGFVCGGRTRRELTSPNCCSAQTLRKQTGEF
uniref:Uncharacterized protein n=1 Tax=Kryptolebias marmoratus TaxID=37003 RepID=A0A3Q3BSC9_KRYMA